MHPNVEQGKRQIPPPLTQTNSCILWPQKCQQPLCKSRWIASISPTSQRHVLGFDSCRLDLERWSAPTLKPHKSSLFNQTGKPVALMAKRDNPIVIIRNSWSVVLREIAKNAILPSSKYHCGGFNDPWNSIQLEKRSYLILNRCILGLQEVFDLYWKRSLSKFISFQILWLLAFRSPVWIICL